MNYASVVQRLFGRVPTNLSLVSVVEAGTPEAAAIEEARNHLADFSDAPRAVARVGDRFAAVGRTHAVLMNSASTDIARIPEEEQEKDPPASVRELTPVEKKNAREHIKHGRKVYRFGRFKPGMVVTWNGERWIVYDARARGGSRFTLMLVSPDYDKLADEVQPSELGETESADVDQTDDPFAGNAWVQASRDIAKLHAEKPRPINKMFGANPTAEQKAKHAEMMREWSKKDREARKRLKAAKAAANETVDESKSFTPAQLAQLRDQFASVERVDPAGPAYDKMIKLLDGMSQHQLKQVAGAGIKFLSKLALNRVKKAEAVGEARVRRVLWSVKVGNDIWGAAVLGPHFFATLNGEDYDFEDGEVYDAPKAPPAAVLARLEKSRLDFDGDKQTARESVQEARFQHGDRVRIHYKNPRTDIEKAFQGKVGSISGEERDGRTRMFRVKFNPPVQVPGVEPVTSDLWAAEFLKPAGAAEAILVRHGTLAAFVAANAPRLAALPGEGSAFQKLWLGEFGALTESTGASRWTLFGKHLSESFQFFDRYDALGIPRPDPATMCKGPCEGTGLVPISRDETDPELRRRWDVAEQESPSDDGWHFVVCPTCEGSRLSEEGAWRTTKSGHKIFVDGGKVTKGNPHVLKAAGSAASGSGATTQGKVTKELYRNKEGREVWRIRNPQGGVEADDIQSDRDAEAIAKDAETYYANPNRESKFAKEHAKKNGMKIVAAPKNKPMVGSKLPHATDGSFIAGYASKGGRVFALVQSPSGKIGQLSAGRTKESVDEASDLDAEIDRVSRDLEYARADYRSENDPAKKRKLKARMDKLDASFEALLAKRKAGAGEGGDGDGKWRTTQSGHKIYIDGSGKVTKGNPHVIGKAKESVDESKLPKMQRGQIWTLSYTGPAEDPDLWLFVTALQKDGTPEGVQYDVMRQRATMQSFRGYTGTFARQDVAAFREMTAEQKPKVGDDSTTPARRVTDTLARFGVLKLFPGISESEVVEGRGAPSWRTLADELIELSNEIDAEAEVSLEVWRGNWNLQLGPGKPTHGRRAAWASATIDPGLTMDDAKEVALDMLDQIKGDRQHDESVGESVSADVHLFKAKDGKWYLSYRRDDGDQEDFSATFYGPFKSGDDAERYLNRNFANPGHAPSRDDSGTLPVPRDVQRARRESVGERVSGANLAGWRVVTSSTGATVRSKDSRTFHVVVDKDGELQATDGAGNEVPVSGLPGYVIRAVEKMLGAEVSEARKSKHEYSVGDRVEVRGEGPGEIVRLRHDSPNAYEVRFDKGGTKVVWDNPEGAAAVGFRKITRAESVDEAQLPKSPHKGKPWDDVVAMGKGHYIVKIWRGQKTKWHYSLDNPQGGGFGTSVEVQDVMSVIRKALDIAPNLKPKRAWVVVGARKPADPFNPFEVATAFWFDTEKNLPESMDEAERGKLLQLGTYKGKPVTLQRGRLTWGERKANLGHGLLPVLVRAIPQMGASIEEWGAFIEKLDAHRQFESIDEAKEVPPIDSPTYRDVAKLPKYNAKVSPLSAHGSDGGKLLAKRLLGWTKADHLAAAAEHERLAAEMEKQWGVEANKAAQAAWGRDYKASDYRISGIASDEFDAKHKDELRRLAHTGTAHKDAAHAHKMAARMRSLAKEDLDEATYYLIRRDDGKFLDGMEWVDEDPGFGFRDMATARKAASDAVIRGKLRKGKFQIVTRDTSDVDEAKVVWSDTVPPKAQKKGYVANPTIGQAGMNERCRHCYYAEAVDGPDGKQVRCLMFRFLAASSGHCSEWERRGSPHAKKVAIPREGVEEGYQHVHFEGSTSARAKVQMAGGKTKSVQGRTFDGKLLVHPTGNYQWGVTHIPTGLGMVPPPGFADDREAVRFAKAASALGGWDFTDPQAIPPDLAQKMGTLVASFRSSIRRTGGGSYESVDEMAKLSAKGAKELMRASKESVVTDDESIDWRRITRAWMDDGRVLEKRDVNFKATGTADYQKARKHSYGWKVLGRFKPGLLKDNEKLAAAMTKTRANLEAEGWAIESFTMPQ